MESDPSEPSYPLVICLTSDLSSSSTTARHLPLSVHGCGFIAPALYPMDVGVTEEEDVVMMLSVVSGIVTSHLMVDDDSASGAEHEDSPFLLVVIGLSFTFGMYGWTRFLMYFFCDVIG